MSDRVFVSAEELDAVVDGTIVADRDGLLWQLRSGWWWSYGCGFEDGPVRGAFLVPARWVAVRAYS